MCFRLRNILTLEVEIITVLDNILPELYTLLF